MQRDRQGANVIGERVAIVGSRNYPNLEHVVEYVRSLPKDAVVVTGAWFAYSAQGLDGYIRHLAEGTRGVDRAAAGAADAHGYLVVLVPALRSDDPRLAGPRRNHLIVALADRVVAFWDGKSTGTMHTVGLARAAGKPVEVRRP